MNLILEEYKEQIVKDALKIDENPGNGVDKETLVDNITTINFAIKLQKKEVAKLDGESGEDAAKSILKDLIDKRDKLIDLLDGVEEVTKEEVPEEKPDEKNIEEE